MLVVSTLSLARSPSDAKCLICRLWPASCRSVALSSRRTWRTFLANHIGDLVSIDLFTVPTARLRVLFVLVILAHHCLPSSFAAE
jgi:hypothetical protein